jgi:methylmalonyl-CoA mutase N-terminal domain/subunit
MRPEIQERQLRRLEEVKRTRDHAKVENLLGQIREASVEGDNLMPYLIDAVREYATVQEICDVWRDVFGQYRDPGYF